GGSTTVQWSGHRADRSGDGGRDIGTGGGDHPSGEGGSVETVFGGRHPVGVECLHVGGVRFTAPTHEEPFGDPPCLVHTGFRHGGQLGSPRGLGDERQRDRRYTGELVADLGVGNVEHRFEAPARCECGQRGLDVGAYVTAAYGNGKRFIGGQAIVEMPVDEQTPNIAEADFARKVLDVHTAIAQ